MIRPLIDDAKRPLDAAQMRDAVFGKDREPQIVYQFGNTVIDFGIEVIRTTCEHDAVCAAPDRFFDRFDTLFFRIAPKLFLFRPRFVDRARDALFRQFRKVRDKLFGQAHGQTVFIVNRQKRIHVQNGSVLPQRIDIVAQHFGIACDDGTIIVIARSRIFLQFVGRAGIENKFYTLLQKAFDVSVRNLSRIAHRLRRNRFKSFFVNRTRRSGRKTHAETERSEKRKPQRIIFVHIEHARNADLSHRCVFSAERNVIVKKPRVFPREHIRKLRFFSRFDIRRFFIARVEDIAVEFRSPLAAVARYELPLEAAGAERVDRQKAVVLAFAAAAEIELDAERLKIRKRGDARTDFMPRSARSLFGLRSRKVEPLIVGDERRTVGSHETCNVGTEHVHTRNVFERAQHGIVVERTALHDDFRADVARLTQFNNFEKRVFNNRIRKTRGDVGDGRAFFLRLLDAAVHKYGTPASQVDGLFGEQRPFAELAHIHTHRARKIVEKAAAAGRAGFVQLNGNDGAVFHAKAFHILPADVE